MAQPYEIQVKTTGDPSGAKAVDQSLQSLNKTVEQSIPAQKKAAEQASNWTKQKGKLKEAVQGLALEFPILARVISVATNPIAAGLLAISSGIAGFARGLQHIRDLGKDDSPLGPIVGDLKSIEALTKGVKQATDEYAESLKTVRDTPQIAAARARLAELGPQPERVTQAEQQVDAAAKRLESARVEVARIEAKYGISDLRTSKQLVRDPAIAALLGGGFESAQRAVNELEESELAYSGSQRLLRSERQRFVNRGLQAGMIQADIDAAGRGEGPLAERNPVYTGPISSGPMQGPMRPMTQLVPVVQRTAEATETAMQAIEARLRAQEQFMRSFTRQQQSQTANLRTP